MTETQEDRARAFSTAQTDAMAAYCNAEHDLKEALAENAGLRGQLEVAEHNRTRNAREYARLCRENDGLRQLAEYCHALLQCVCDGQDERGEGCPLWADRGEECDLREVERRMRELGIGEGRCSTGRMTQGVRISVSADTTT